MNSAGGQKRTFGSFFRSCDFLFEIPPQRRHRTALRYLVRPDQVPPANTKRHESASLQLTLIIIGI
jgi:hypothetical protein